MKGTKMAAAMTLLVVLSCSLTAYSAPVVNDVTSEDFPLERECVYQLKRYAHASTVETEEPCLNCTCNRGVLVCFLRVCHNLVAPPTSACRVVKPPGKCCSELVCGEQNVEVTPTKSTNVTVGPTLSVTESGESVLDEKSGVLPSTLVTDEQPGTTIGYVSADDDSDLWSTSLAPTTFDELIKSGCEQNGSIYAEGSAMPSSTFCDYCYCIRGLQRCIQPQCHLQIDECQPIYRHDYSCCPTAYKCSKFQPEVSSTTPLPPSHKGCDVNGTFYHEGKAVVSEDNCQNCFCVNGKVECSVTRCAMQLTECRPIVQPGKCCPTGYNCSYVNIIEDSELSTTEDETVVESRISGEDIELANDTAEYSNQTEETTTELPDYLSSTPPSDVTNEIINVPDDSVTTENSFSIEERSDNNDFGSTEVNIEGPTMADDVLQGRLDGATDSGIESDGNATENASTVSEADVNQSSVEYGNETESEVSTYWPEFEETNLDERIANISLNSTVDNEENVTVVTIGPGNLQAKHENRSSSIEIQNENQITYRTSSGNPSDNLHNITVQLVENVAEQLLTDSQRSKDKLTIHKHIDGNNNFSNWTHVENETDLLQTSNVNRPVIESNNLTIASPAANENNSHVTTSANLHGSLHSIVSSLLAKPDITTEGSQNYSVLFDDLIGEAPGEFHFNPINYLNFSEELSTPSSYRQDFYPTTIKSNEISQTITNRIDNFTSEPNVLLDHQIDHYKSNISATADEPPDNSEGNIISISNNESEIDHQSQISSVITKNSSLPVDSLTLPSNMTTADPLQYSGILLDNQTIDSDLKNESLKISADSIEYHLSEETSNSSSDSKIHTVLIDPDSSNSDHDNSSKLTTPLVKLHSDVTTTSESDEPHRIELTTHKTDTIEVNKTDAIVHDSGEPSNDVMAHHSDVESNETIVHFEDEAETTHSSFSESDLEDTIEMILNLSKTLAASNKRPTQWHPSENNSATDLLSGTLPADVEAKLTEIIRMAQAGLIPTEEPFPTHHLNISFNFDQVTTTAPPDDGDEYYNEYYDDEAKETVPPSLLDEPTNTNTSVINNEISTISQHPAVDDSFQKDLHDVLQPLSNISSQLSPTEELRTDDETLPLVQLTTLSPNKDLSSSTTSATTQQPSTTVKHPTTSSASSLDYFAQPEVDHQYDYSENFNNSVTESVSSSHGDQISDKFDAYQPEVDTYNRPSYDEQSFNGNEKFPHGMSESVVAEQDDQIGAGSIVHQDEQPVGGEAGALFEETPEEHGPAQTNDEDGEHFDGLIGAPNDEEKSYFSSDDNFENRPNDQKEEAFEHEQPADNVFEPPTPTEAAVHVDQAKPNVDTTPITYDNFNTEHFPELQPELVKEFIDSIKFGSSDVESRSTTKYQPTFVEVTTHQPSTELTSNHPTSQPSNKLIDFFDDFNHFDKGESQVHDEHVTLPDSPLQTEAVTSDANKPFVGLVTKGSIQFDHVLPLSRRGRPTTDEKTGQALPTPRKSNSSMDQPPLTSPADGVLDPVDEDTPAVIPFLPEDAITDEHLLKEPLFGGGGEQPIFERPLIIERNDQNVNNRSDFALHVSASTAINVHDPNKPELEPLEPEVKGEGVAIPESHDYADEIPAEIPVESPAIVNTTPRPSVNHTDGPLVVVTTERLQTAQPALPKFDDHREQSPSALGLQQTPEYCVENGEVFQDGERIPTHDFCAQCRCVKGEIQCQHLSCPQKPKGCTEKIVPSSCCPAFVCNETENGDVPIRSGITIHSGFTPIDRPVVPSDHQPPKASVVNSADLGFESEDAAVDHSRPSLTTIPVESKIDTSTRPTDEDHGIFGSLLEAVFGHGFDQGDNRNRTLLDSIADIPAMDPEEVSEAVAKVTRMPHIETTLRTTTTTTTTTARPSTVTRKRTTTTTTPPTTTAKEPNAMMWPMLKVSGCNIYGRVYQVGATIGVLSGPCKECKCTNRGVDCYKVKCF